MITNNILVITEGKKTEPKLIDKCFKLVNQSSFLSNCFNYNIVPYGTNIYALYDRFNKYKTGVEFYTSTIEILNEIYKDEPSEELKRIIDTKFQYIYLIFDFEYQDNHHNFEDKIKILKEMLSIFNDETENGLLFINYPMIEAYRDLKQIDCLDESFKDRVIDCSEVKDYKTIVSERGNILDINKYTVDNYKNILIANIKKENFIINNLYELPDYNFVVNNLGKSNILMKEINFIETNGKIQVLCETMFILIAYFGERLYKRLL